MFSLLIKLVEFLIVLSAIRSGLKYVQRLWTGLKSAPVRRSEPSAAASTVMKMDPVCGTYVSVESSFKKISGGQVYHFCSSACRDRFA